MNPESGFIPGRAVLLVTIRCHGLDFYFLAGGVNGFSNFFS